MQNKTNLDILSSSSEDLSDKDEAQIITNNDEFCAINELQPNLPKNKTEVNNNQKKNNNIISKIHNEKMQPIKINEPYKISNPIQNITNTDNINLYSLLLNGDNSTIPKKNSKKKLKYKKKSKKKAKNNFNKDNLNLKNFLDVPKKNGKSVFLKISEDIYTKLKSKPNKEVRDINKTEEDAYNKMTSDPYIRTCENKENTKNKKIVQQCLDRKAKEDIFKKIGIECDRNREKKKLQDPKRAYSVTDRNNNLKSTRTLAQFLRDQNGERKKEKKLVNKNNKKNNNEKVKGNILPQDSTFIFSEGKEEKMSQISDFTGNFLDYENDCKSMIQNNEKFFMKIEEEKDNKNESKINKTFEIEKNGINGDNFSLIITNNFNSENNKFKNNKRIKNTFNSNSNKSNKKNSKNIKDTLSTSLSKNSLENNSKKFINLYKETIDTLYGQKIENNFDINFTTFLLILYKIGFINKNYSALLEFSYESDTKKMSTMHPSVISDISLSNSSSINNNNNSSKINKRNYNNNLNNLNKNSIGGKSLEDEGQNYTMNFFKNEKEFSLSRDAWKILTEKKDFDEEICISSKIFFLFFISVLGIGEYLRLKKFQQKEFDFFFNDKKIMNQYNNMKKYINKYFSIFSANASENTINSEKNNLEKENFLNNYSNNYENENSIATSFIVNNSDINNKYNIYGKNYNKIKNNIENFEDTNSIQFFNEGIKEEEKFFLDNDNYCDKSSKTLTFTDINLNNIENNHNNNLLNNSITDSSSILDLKKFLNPNASEKMEDDLDFDSFLFEDNNKNYFKYGNNGDKIYESSEVKANEEEKVKKNNNKNSNNNSNKKRIKYVFEIKVENEMKKLILKKGEDKNLVVKNFCEKYNINEKEKNKILKIIEDRLKNLK